MLADCYCWRLFCKSRHEHPGFQGWQHNERNGFRRDCDRVCRTLLSDICCARPVADLTHARPPACRAGAEGEAQGLICVKNPSPFGVSRKLTDLLPTSSCGSIEPKSGEIMRTSLILALSVMCCQPALAACGDKGGPGYRNSSGNCVGWEALARQCGNPPTTKCTAERVATAPLTPQRAAPRSDR